MKTLKQFVEEKNILIAAHRGASGEAPENTMAAFKLGLKQGANMIEADLQFTVEDVAVAFHDRRHLKFKGANKPLSLENLGEIDVGAWFSPKFAGEKIPSLKEITGLVKDRAYLNLEIKGDDSSITDKRIENVISAIYDKGIKESSMVSSFDYNLLKKIHKIDSDIHIAAIYNAFEDKNVPQIVEETGCEAIICSLGEINKKMASDAKADNIFLGVYEVDNKSEFNYAMKFEVAALGTNYPAKIKQYVEERL